MLIVSLLAVGIILSIGPVLALHHLWIRFTSRKIAVNRAKYPTLYRIQTHFYVSDTKRRLKEHETRQATIKAERAAALRALSEYEREKNLAKRPLYKAIEEFDEHFRYFPKTEEARVLPDPAETPEIYEPPADLGEQQIVVATQSVYVREQPHPASRIMGMFPQGSHIAVYGAVKGEPHRQAGVITSYWLPMGRESGYIWAGVTRPAPDYTPSTIRAGVITSKYIW